MNSIHLNNKMQERKYFRSDAEVHLAQPWHSYNEINYVYLHLC
jgi:hypothetical protein